MTLQASGAISMGQIDTELGLSSTAAITLNDSNVRLLGGVSSGAISMSNFYSKSWIFAFNTSVTSGQINVRSAAIAAGWGGTQPVQCTINSNSYSNSTGTPTVLISGSFPDGLTLVVASGVYVAGKGGAGANGNPGTWGSSGGAGGTAISISSYTGGTLSINNLGYIGGGGGGGGSGPGQPYAYSSAPGGGGGGGAGFGPGGSPGGGTGTINSGGGGGSGSGTYGGSGGGLGSSGGYGSNYNGGAGGGGGAAITGSVAAGVVWINTGTRYGSVG